MNAVNSCTNAHCVGHVCGARVAAVRGAECRFWSVKMMVLCYGGQVSQTFDLFRAAIEFLAGYSPLENRYALLIQ